MNCRICDGCCVWKGSKKDGVSAKQSISMFRHTCSHFVNDLQIQIDEPGWIASCICESYAIYSMLAVGTQQLEEKDLRSHIEISH